MKFRDFTVHHAQGDSDFVIGHGWDDQQMIFVSIPTTCLADHFERRELSGKQANQLVDRNREAFSRIISAKYERGEHSGYAPSISTGKPSNLKFPRVKITLADIETSGETLTDSVLNTSAGWMETNGKWSSV